MTDDEIAKILLFLYNLTYQEETYYEQWDLNETEHVFRFANIETPMNIYIKFEEPV